MSSVVAQQVAMPRWGSVVEGTRDPYRHESARAQAWGRGCRAGSGTPRSRARAGPAAAGSRSCRGCDPRRPPYRPERRAGARPCSCRRRPAAPRRRGPAPESPSPPPSCGDAGAGAARAVLVAVALAAFGASPFVSPSVLAPVVGRSVRGVRLGGREAPRWARGCAGARGRGFGRRRGIAILGGLRIRSVVARLLVGGCEQPVVGAGRGTLVAGLITGPDAEDVIALALREREAGRARARAPAVEHRRPAGQPALEGRGRLAGERPADSPGAAVRPRTVGDVGSAGCGGIEAVARQGGARDVPRAVGRPRRQRIRAVAGAREVPADAAGARLPGPWRGAVAQQATLAGGTRTRRPAPSGGWCPCPKAPGESVNVGGDGATRSSV